jgi:hypothetical protein
MSIAMQWLLCSLIGALAVYGILRGSGLLTRKGGHCGSCGSCSSGKRPRPHLPESKRSV